MLHAQRFNHLWFCHKIQFSSSYLFNFASLFQVILNALGLLLRLHIRGEISLFKDSLKNLAELLTDKVSKYSLLQYIYEAFQIEADAWFNFLAIKLAQEFYKCFFNGAFVYCTFLHTICNRLWWSNEFRLLWVIHVKYTSIC